MKTTKELLFQSYDRELTADEQRLLDTALESYVSLRQEKEELENLRVLFSDYQPEFSEDFQQNILDRIYHSAKPNEFFQLFKAVALSGVAAILLILLTIYFTDGSLNIDAIYGLSNYTPDEELFTYLNY
jgi:hypothetical protein